MLKFLVGPVVVGAAYAAGRYYGADAEQVVHRDRGYTYAAVDRVIGNMRSSGTTFFDGGTPTSYEIKVDRTPDEKLNVLLFFSGKKGAEADLSFIAENGGRDTLISARIHADRAVLGPVLAGTDKARLAYAPDWMLNLSLRPLLKQLAGQIELGGTAEVDGVSNEDAEAKWEANLGSDERDQLMQWRQFEATRPSVDPVADARNSTDRTSN